MQAQLSSHMKIKCSIEITSSPSGSGHALREATTSACHSSSPRVVGATPYAKQKHHYQISREFN